MFEAYIFPILLFAGMGILAGVLLTAASKIFEVKSDPRVDEVGEALPQVNCGACGYSGCSDYAKAIVEKGEKPNLCKPGGAKSADKISEIMGVSAGAAEKQIAVVRCSADCESKKQSFEFEGELTCVNAKRFYGGMWGCKFSCLGQGDCAKVCPSDAIVIKDGLARIDKSECIGCGMCAKVCPFSAIVNRKRPCQGACKVKAISMDENKAAKIDYEKCIACGACVYQCPFGALSDKSFILDAIKMLKNCDRVYAIVAPAIVSQFTYAKPGQVITAIKALGFCDVLEAALGADMVAYNEAAELAERGFLTSSCCPAFVSYIEKNLPDLVPFVSHNLSPMTTISRYLKEHEAPCKVVFIGPCTAKKAEVQKKEVRPYVDAAMTFEELQALFDSRDMDITILPLDVLDNASYFGRIFARCGGLSDAVAEGLKEHGITDFELKSAVCDGIEECRTALVKKSRNVLAANFVEGMACAGGCIGGAGTIADPAKTAILLNKYVKEAPFADPEESPFMSSIHMLKDDPNFEV